MGKPIPSPVYVTQAEAAIITSIPAAMLQKDRSLGVGIPYHKIGFNVRYKVSECR